MPTSFLSVPNAENDATKPWQVQGEGETRLGGNACPWYGKTRYAGGIHWNVAMIPATAELQYLTWLNVEYTKTPFSSHTPLLTRMFS